MLFVKIAHGLLLLLAFLHCLKEEDQVKVLEQECSSLPSLEPTFGFMSPAAVSHPVASC